MERHCLLPRTYSIGRVKENQRHNIKNKGTFISFIHSFMFIVPTNNTNHVHFLERQGARCHTDHLIEAVRPHAPGGAVQ